MSAIVLGSLAAGTAEAPIEPALWRVVIGVGGMAALVAVFLAYDLLSTVIAQFSATLLIARSSVGDAGTALRE